MTEANRPKTSKRRHAIVVAGMHRSGTSALAGVLHRLGAELPATPLPPNENNPDGYAESRVICDLHDALLSEAGSSWDQVRGPAHDWFTSIGGDRGAQELAGAIQDEFGDAELFVLKDPRICRLLPLWKRVFEQLRIDASYLIAVRDPDAVARSLQIASDVPPAIGELLWLDHLLCAERETRDQSRAFVSYACLQDDWRVELARASEHARLPLPRADRSCESRIDAFLRRDRTPREAAGPRHPWIDRAWQCALAACEDPLADTEAFDALRGAFATAEAAFGPALGGAQQRLQAARDERREHAAQTRDLTERIDTAAEQRRELQTRLTRRREAAEALRKSVELLMRWVLDRSRSPDEPAPAELRAALSAIEKAPPAEIPQIASTAALLAEKNLRIRALELERARRANELVEAGRCIAQHESEHHPANKSDAEERLLGERARLSAQLERARQSTRETRAALESAELERDRLSDRLDHELRARPRSLGERIFGSRSRK